VTRTRLLPVLLVIALGAACGNGDDDPAGPTTSTSGGATTTTSAPAASVDYARPGQPVRIGSGIVEGATPDGSALYVAEEDGAFPEPGCEGQPEPVLFRLPLAGGDRVRLGTATEPVRGRLVPGPGDRVAVVDECEGFLQSVRVGTRTAAGELQRLRVVPVQEDDESLRQPRISAWSNDGDALLAGGVSEATGDGLVATIGVDDGEITPLFATGSGAGPSQVGQLADGTFVVAADGEVTLRSAGGEVQQTLPGNGFALTPDRRRVVAYGEAVAIVSPGSEPETLVPARTGRQVVLADVSPDGRAVAVAVSAGEETEVQVVTLADRAVTGVGPGGLLGRPTFSGDGRALGFNRFGRAPDFVNDAFVVRFEG
jgi:hypothetical protein